jgi:hypothetical protein
MRVRPRSFSFASFARSHISRLQPPDSPRARRARDLVRAAGTEIDIQQRRGLAELLDRLERRHCVLTFACTADHSFPPCFRLVLSGRSIVFVPNGQRPATSAGSASPSALAQLRVQVAQDSSPLCDEQAAAGLTIEPMNELELLELRMRGAQCLDDAKADPLPPCTATPAGLFTTMRSRSS